MKLESKPANYTCDRLHRHGLVRDRAEFELDQGRTARNCKKFATV
ncbi:hypothetical protein DLM_0169 [Aquitalea magnusonii]|uniref:Uncharacterized protein n=1 Tax=Aquitalea magnusonii TaxID=332411 RepID=A0A3G9GCM0_9NEIS|nr:hypothetical protein DLM_0169 [Aquitalea magnusonii]